MPNVGGTSYGSTSTSGAVTNFTAYDADVTAIGGDVYVSNLTMNNGTLTATVQEGTDGSSTGGNITLGAPATNDSSTTGIVPVQGQGSVHAAKDLTLMASYTGAATDDLNLIAGNNIDANDKDITAKGGQLTLNAGGTITANNITANTLTAAQLTATGNVALSDGDLQLSSPASPEGGGEATDGSSVTGTLTLTNMETSITGGLTVTGVATASGKTLKADSLVFTGGVTFSDGIVATIDSLTVGDATGTQNVDTTTSANLIVGLAEDTAGSTLNVANLTLNGNSLLIDPAYGYDPSTASIENFANETSTSDGNIGVGQNGMFTFGLADSGDWLKGQLATIGITQLSEEGVGSVVGLYNLRVSQK